MGTSDGGAGSGGAWSGFQQGVSDFADDPTDDAAETLVDRGLRALERDTEEQEVDGEAPDTLPRVAPEANPLPGLRLRTRSGSGGGIGASARGGGGGGGRRRTGGGGGRSSGQAARAGGRALAAGFALQRGDAAALDDLGLSLATLQGLGPNEQINLILNITIPATGSPLDAEMRIAAGSALIRLLKDGVTDPQQVVQEFVVEYAFETLVAEYGPKFRDGSRPGTTLKQGERRLRSCISGYAGGVELPDQSFSAKDFEKAIETVSTKTRELVGG
jgi:hypothetical protein